MVISLFLLFIMSSVFSGFDAYRSDCPSSELMETLRPIKVKITGRLHRKRGTGRDGVACDCSNCFGICEVRFEIELRDPANTEYSPLVLQYEPSLNTARVYILESEDYFNSSFVIDEDLSLVQRALSSRKINQLTIKSGQYTFIEHQGCMFFEGRYLDYAGYVDVNIQGE